VNNAIENCVGERRIADDLSWLNPTPHAIAVYASHPLSPVATQHSLPSGRYSLLGLDLHRLDRTSFSTLNGGGLGNLGGGGFGVVSPLGIRQSVPAEIGDQI
jgi:hypothetical protein